MLALKIHPFPLRYHKVLFTVVEEVRLLCVIPTSSFGCSAVPDDLFLARIPESQPKGEKCGNKLEWFEGRETFVQETGRITHLCVKSNDIFYVKVLSSGPHTRSCPSACLRTAPDIDIISSLQQFWSTARSGFTRLSFFGCSKYISSDQAY